MTMILRTLTTANMLIIAIVDFPLNLPDPFQISKILLNTSTKEKKKKKKNLVIGTFLTGGRESTDRPAHHFVIQ